MLGRSDSPAHGSGNRCTHGPRFALLGLALLALTPSAFAQAPSVPNQPGGSGQEILANIPLEPDLSAVPVEVKPPAHANTGTALLVVRATAPKVERSVLENLGEQFGAGFAPAGLKLVSLRDLYGSSTGSASGKTEDSGKLAFANEEAFCQQALAHQMPLVVVVDLLHINEREVSAGGESMRMVSVRASAVLLNAADRQRTAQTEYEAKARGFAAPDTVDKALKLLAQGLGRQVSSWEIPKPEIKLHELTVRAVLDGWTVPVLLKPENPGEQETGEASVKVTQLPIYASNASVEIDNVLVGRAPCKVQVSAGLHRLVVRREGCLPFEANLNVVASNEYEALLALSPETKAELSQQLKEIEELKLRRVATAQKLKLEANRAEAVDETHRAWADTLRGVGQFFRQTGFYVRSETKK